MTATGRGAATARQKPSLCELQTRRRCLQPCGGRRRREMENAIPTRARRPWRRSRPQVAAPRCGGLPRNKSTINPRGRDYIINNNLHIRSGGAALRRRRMMPSFSSSFIDSTATTATDDAEAPAKYGLEEETADGTAGPADPLTPSQRRTEEVAPPPPPPHQSSSMSLNNQQISIAAIDK